MAKKRDLKEIDAISKEVEEILKKSNEIDHLEEKEEKRKKTIIIVAVALVAVLLGVLIGGIIYTETRSPISFGPHASEKEKSSENVKYHEDMIEKLDAEVPVTRGELYYQSYYAEIRDNGDLVLEGYMRNFTGHDVYEITGNITVETPNQEHIGSAYFTFPVDEFGTLKNGFSRPWRIIIESDYVNVEIVDLSEYKVITEFEFKYK